MVPGAGLEPARSCLRGILSPLCLPIPPPGLEMKINYILISFILFKYFPNLVLTETIYLRTLVSININTENKNKTIYCYVKII